MYYTILMTKSVAKTSWSLYTENDLIIESMLAACENAKESIDLEQFIFITDEIGQRFIDVCIKKASQGVKIRFLWDAAGSFSFYGSNIVEHLKEKNIVLVFFKTLLPSFFEYHNYRSWYLRNHRRTLVVDNKIGFTGSICVAEAMKNWRDTVVRIQGPVVNEMRDEFERMWQRALKQKVKYTKTNTNAGYDDEFSYLTNSPLPRRHDLYKELIKSIREAEEYIYITTPYFVPTRHLARVIKASARRGVDIKIIVPEWSDHPIVDLCSRSFYKEMLDAGVKIYLYRGNIIHSKTIVIDDAWSTIGTLNLDTASLIYNFEANIVSTNTDFTSELKEHFKTDLFDTYEVLKKDWDNRFWFEKFAGSFAKLLRDFM